MAQSHMHGNEHMQKTHAHTHTWVGDHDQGAVRAVLHDLWDDGPEDVDVPLDQVEATLALLLTNSCRHHHQAGVGRHRVVWRCCGRKRKRKKKSEDYA